MKVELHINGDHEIILTPESEIERVVLSTMASNAEKGQAVHLSANRRVDNADTDVPVGTLLRAVIGVAAK